MHRRILLYTQAHQGIPRNFILKFETNLPRYTVSLLRAGVVWGKRNNQAKTIGKVLDKSFHYSRTIMRLFTTGYRNFTIQ